MLQNATVRRSVQMMENLFREFGGRVRCDGRELSCFWAPRTLAVTSEQRLRELEVGYRAKALLRPWRMLAAHYLFEGLFRWHREEPVPWLEPLLRYQPSRPA